MIDHNNEETVRAVLDRGFWAGFTLYPQTKMGNERMVEIVRQYGSERIFIDSSADWGVSDPLAVPKTGRLMLERGIALEDVEATCYGNALRVYGQSGQFARGPLDDARGRRPAIAFRRQLGAARADAARGRRAGAGCLGRGRHQVTPPGLFLDTGVPIP
ncbi:MAG: hypothetical protein V9G29_13795 [Burkholderiaceae bacterium]